MLIAIIVIVILATAGLAFVGQRIGANMEAPNLGAGTTEQEMRSALSPSVLGALLGIVPFLLFIVVLIWMAMHVPHEAPADGSGGSAPTAEH